MVYATDVCLKKKIRTHLDFLTYVITVGFLLTYEPTTDPYFIESITAETDSHSEQQQ